MERIVGEKSRITAVTSTGKSTPLSSTDIPAP
jgi:hypothetical protein